MKFKESKYYTPRKLLITDCNGVVGVSDDEKEGFNDSYYTLLSRHLCVIDLEYDGFIIQEHKLKDFEQCTDFTRLSYSTEKNSLMEIEYCYYHPIYEIFMTIKPNIATNDDDENEIFEKGLFAVKEIFYDQQRENIKGVLEKLLSDYVQKHKVNKAKIFILVKTREGFELKPFNIKPYVIDIETMYNDEFLPIHQHIFENIKETKKGVVLLHGLAGAGKTNYIKWLTSQIPDKKFIFIPTNLISQLASPELFSLLIDNKNSVLVLEDCENYIAERNNGNQHSDVVASILNLADGMLSDIAECQMICSFNADIDKIDSALLRAGRLIAEYRFKELNIQKANDYLKSVGIEKTVDKPMTLAELTNLEKQLFKEQEVKKQKIGFI